jgi:hypothetical protein
MPNRVVAPLCALFLLAGACSTPTRSFGAPIEVSGAELTIASLLAAPNLYDGKNVVVVGQVHEVCQRMGCWLTLAAGGREVRVTFHGQGFFVPTDSAGATVRAKGRFAIRDMPVEEARHYLEDAGRAAEAQGIVDPVRSFTLAATGVELLP